MSSANDNRRPMSELGKILFELSTKGIRAQFPTKPVITRRIVRPSQRKKS